MSGWGGGGRGSGWSEAFVKIKKMYIFFGGGVRSGGWGRVGGVRVDGNGEVKLLRTLKKNFFFWGGGGSGSRWGVSGWGGGSGWM